MSIWERPRTLNQREKWILAWEFVQMKRILIRVRELQYFNIIYFIFTARNFCIDCDTINEDHEITDHDEPIPESDDLYPYNITYITYYLKIMHY